MMSGQDTLLLQNATATGLAVAWPGGPGLMQVVGTFSGASVALQQLGPDGATYIAAGPVATVADSYPFNLPPGLIKGVIVGSPTGIYARVTSTTGGLVANSRAAAGGDEVHFPARAGTSRSLQVTTASQTVMAANTARLKAILANDSGVSITVKFGATAVAGAALDQRVMKNGDYWEIDFYTGIITAIHADTGNKPLFAWEV